MIVLSKPKIPQKTIIEFEKIINYKNKSHTFFQKIFNALTSDQKDIFMTYISWKFKYDLKEYNLFVQHNQQFPKKISEFIIAILPTLTGEEVLNESQLIYGIRLGSIYQIKYLNYEHDPFPLAIFMTPYDSTHNNFHAINLHYLEYNFRKIFVKKMYDMNKIRIDKKEPTFLNYDLAQRINPAISFAYRNYKAQHIRVVEEISPSRWRTYLEIDKSNIRLVK